MILWCDGAHDPAENMRRDVALLERCDRAASEHPTSIPEAVLRLFRFEPHGITLGHAQRAERVLDLDRCRAHGVPWAVRPTGGRAIFHAEEWTYSLTAAIADPEWGGSLAAAYARASALIRGSLVSLGVPAELAARAPINGSGVDRSAARSSRAVSRSDHRDPPPHEVFESCFVSTARHEVLLQGRKLVGSAQRRTARSLLQQGSVLLGPAHARLADYLVSSASDRERGRAEIELRSTHAGEILPSDSPLELWAEALMKELPNGTQRVDSAAGGFLLTL
jgi:lipoate-protein ligase A